MLFRYLHTSQRSVLLEDRVLACGRATPPTSCSRASSRSGRGDRHRRGRAGHRVDLVVRAGGPDSELYLPKEVLQARSGSLSNHGHMDRPPLTVGGQLGEYVTGAFAALGAVTAWWRAAARGARARRRVHARGDAVHVRHGADRSWRGSRAGAPATFRWVMIPGNEPTRDGRYVGITTVTPRSGGAAAR